MGGQAVSEETLAIAREALSKANPPALLEVLAKAGWTQSGTATTGITYYSLEAPSKHFVPFLSPLRNEIPRNSGGLGIQANWKAITAVNTKNLTIGVAEGKRGGQVTTDTADYFAKFVTLGLEDKYTDDARRAAKSFEDLKALSGMNLLDTFMVEEERVILGGLGTYGLGTTPTPTGTLQTADGAMTAQATYCYVVALTIEGLRQSGGPGTQTTATAYAVPTTVARTRAGAAGGTDTVNLGQAKISAVIATPVTTATSNLGVIWKVASVPGAAGYAWFTGPTGIGNALLTAITTVNQFHQTADAPATILGGGANQAANASGLSTDHSADSLVFDGLIAQAAKAGSGAYVKSLGGAGFTEVGDGTVTELEDATQIMWDQKRLGINRLWMNSKDRRNLKKHILSKSGAPSYTVMVPNGGGPVEVVGGSRVVEYLNSQTGEIIKIDTHPYLPQGMAIGYTMRLPYKLNDVPNVAQMDMRLDYYMEEWPRYQREDEFGVYEDGVLKVYFPGAFCLFQDIGDA